MKERMEEIVDIAVGEREDDRLGFSVRDRGEGLGTADPSTLFGRFAQGDASAHTQHHGFGLGLHIVRSYMELMNGKVEARNHPDGGALFTCWFPNPVDDQEVSHEGQRAHRG